MSSSKTSTCLKKARAEENESSIVAAEKTLLSEAEADKFFSLLKEKIQLKKCWNKHGSLSSYELFNERGEQLETGKIAPGVFIRINLKGSGKFDWVKVVDIFEAENEFVITVRPSFDPTAENPDKSIVSHFFTDASTNNFCIVKDFKTIKFYIIGLDEKQNLSETANVLQTARNAFVNLGSHLGVQRSEWGKFTESFVNATFEKIRAQRKSKR